MRTRKFGEKDKGTRRTQSQVFPAKDLSLAIRRLPFNSVSAIVSPHRALFSPLSSPSFITFPSPSILYLPSARFFPSSVTSILPLSFTPVLLSSSLPLPLHTCSAPFPFPSSAIPIIASRRFLLPFFLPITFFHSLSFFFTLSTPSFLFIIPFLFIISLLRLSSHFPFFPNLSFSNFLSIYMLFFLSFFVSFTVTLPFHQPLLCIPLSPPSLLYSLLSRLHPSSYMSTFL